MPARCTGLTIVNPKTMRAHNARMALQCTVAHAQGPHTRRRTRVCRWYRYPDAHGGTGTSRFAWVYGSMGLLFLMVQLLRTGTFYWWALTGAGRLFRGALHRVLNTPMAFLLVKPVGELLAAFTSDQDKVDEALPDAVHLAGACAQIPRQLSEVVDAHVKLWTHMRLLCCVGIWSQSRRSHALPCASS